MYQLASGQKINTINCSPNTKPLTIQQFVFLEQNLCEMRNHRNIYPWWYVCLPGMTRKWIFVVPVKEKLFLYELICEHIMKFYMLHVTRKKLWEVTIAGVRKSYLFNIFFIIWFSHVLFCLWQLVLVDLLKTVLWM